MYANGIKIYFQIFNKALYYNVIVLFMTLKKEDDQSNTAQVKLLKTNGSLTKRSIKIIYDFKELMELTLTDAVLFY